MISPGFRRNVHQVRPRPEEQQHNPHDEGPEDWRPSLLWLGKRRATREQQAYTAIKPRYGAVKRAKAETDGTPGAMTTICVLYYCCALASGTVQQVAGAPPHSPNMPTCVLWLFGLLAVHLALGLNTPSPV